MLKNSVAGLRRQQRRINNFAQRQVDKAVPLQARQLMRLRHSFRAANCPDILIIGNSSWYSKSQTDSPSTRLTTLVSSALGDSFKVASLIGPAYNPRISAAFLDFFDEHPFRPRLLILPASIYSAMSVWDMHPRYRYEREAAHIRTRIMSGTTWLPPRSLEPTEHEFTRYHSLHAASLVGAQRTIGEHELLRNSRPTSPQQRAIRSKALMDFYVAEGLGPESPGVQSLRDLGALVEHLGIPSVACIFPVNYQLARAALGSKASQRILDNAALLEATYSRQNSLCGVVNAATTCRASDFMDPLHLRAEGRIRLAEQLMPMIQRALSISSAPSDL